MTENTEAAFPPCPATGCRVETPHFHERHGPFVGSRECICFLVEGKCETCRRLQSPPDAPRPDCANCRNLEDERDEALGYVEPETRYNLEKSWGLHG